VPFPEALFQLQFDEDDKTNHKPTRRSPYYYQNQYCGFHTLVDFTGIESVLYGAELSRELGWCRERKNLDAYYFRFFAQHVLSHLH